MGHIRFRLLVLMVAHFDLCSTLDLPDIGRCRCWRYRNLYSEVEVAEVEVHLSIGRPICFGNLVQRNRTVKVLFRLLVWKIALCHDGLDDGRN
jgi:hypothetical protein